MTKNNTPVAQNVLAALRKLASKEKATSSARFFKTGPGQYGQRDMFWGVTVPEQRAIARVYKDLSLLEIKKLLLNPYHEARLTGLIILVGRFERTGISGRKSIAMFYLKHKDCVNNWDLVDTSAHKILGAYLFNKDRKILYTLACSKSMWDRRIAIVASAAFIAQRDFKDTLALAELLLGDRQDLMHKAVGWMLREVGKKDELALQGFLSKNYHIMPRTMLRYAIERLSKVDRLRYLRGAV